jgi:ankyrin repeat protein
VAADKGYVAIIRVLLAGGGQPSRATLDAAVHTGNREAIQLIEDSLRRLVEPVKPWAPALIKAAAESNFAAPDLALANGVAVDATEGRGETALNTAAFQGRPEVVRRLLKAGADPNHAGYAGVRRRISRPADRRRSQPRHSLVAGRRLR